MDQEREDRGEEAIVMEKTSFSGMEGRHREIKQVLFMKMRKERSFPYLHISRTNKQ